MLVGIAVFWMIYNYTSYNKEKDRPSIQFVHSVIENIFSYVGISEYVLKTKDGHIASSQEKWVGWDT